MKYVSVGCVVGIIAGFCIGPGEFFVFVTLSSSLNLFIKLIYMAELVSVMLRHIQ